MITLNSAAIWPAMLPKIRRLGAALLLVAAGSLPLGLQAETKFDGEKLQERQIQLDKDLAIAKERFEAKLEAQDKRIADMGLTVAQQANHIAMVGNYISWTSIALSLFGVLAGFFAYRGTVRKAKEESEKAAQDWFANNTNALHQESQKAAQDWFKDNTQALIQQINELREKAETATASIDQHQQDFQLNASSANQQVQETLAATMSKLSAAGKTADSLPQATRDLVKQAGEQIKSKPENQYTAEDYYTAGVSAYFDQNPALAYERFSQAVSLSNSSPAELQAKYLGAQAVTLAQLNRFDEAFATYDAVIARFGSNDRPALREQVAQAMVNKGVTLAQLNRFDEAFAIYDAVIARFGSDNSPALRERVAQAINGKGFTLILQAKQTPELPSRKQRLGKACEAMKAVSHTHISQDVSAALHGNIGYAAWLLGEQATARASTEQCLILGGKDALNAQRKDAQTHRLEPEDSGYEALLDELWEKIQAQAGSKGGNG